MRINNLIIRLIKNKALLLLFFMAITIHADAQQAESTIIGVVSSEQGSAIEGVTVLLDGSSNVAITNDKGEFSFSGISQEKAAFSVSGIGYATQRQSVTIKPGQEKKISITLKTSEHSLQQVEIVGRKNSSYRSSYTFGATKTATNLEDIPQAVSIVTKELILDRQIDKAWDATKMMSGVNRYSNYNDIVIRGFRSGENQPRLINGLRSAFGYFDQPVTANLERIEVIKGPASALFGNSVPGGTINFVTKKPLPEKRYALSFTGGSFNTFRTAGDFTGPIKDSTILYRINAAYSNAESFRSLQFGENHMIAPSISFIPDSKTSINVDLVYNMNNSKIDRGQPIFGATSNTDIYSTPINLAIGSTNDYYKVKNIQLSAGFSHKFSEKLSANASYMKFGWNEALLEHRTSNTFALNSEGSEISSMVAMQVFDRLQKLYSDNINTFFSYKLSNGAIKQTLLIGYDFIQQTRPVGGTQNVARGYRNAANNGTINTYNPAKKSDYLLDKDGNPVPNVNHFDINNVQYKIGNITNYLFASTVYAPSSYLVNGLYLQDQIQYNKWQFLLGLRQESYTDYSNHRQDNEVKVTQHALIPRVGLIYSLINNINLYGTYTEGYQPQSPATFNNPNNGGPFDPTKSDMIEGGAKGVFFGDQLSINLSVYQINQKNVLVYANDPVNPELYRQRGREQARGIEFEAIGSIVSNLSVNANYAYNQAIVKEGLESEIGIQRANAPKHLAGLWLKYGLTKGNLSGLGLGTGISHVSERNTELASLQLPSYTTVDCAAYYTFNKVRLSANLNNIFNQKYWIAGYNYTRIFPGEPRNMMFNISKLF